MTASSRLIRSPHRQASSRSPARGADGFTVELLGARGVGKSTLARLLAAELRAMDLLAVPTFAPGVRAKLSRHLTTLGDRSRFIYSSLAWRPLSARDLKTFRKRYRRLRLRSVTPYQGRGVHLFDEGVFQLIMELQAKTAQKDIRRIARRLSTLLPSPDLVIVVEASDETIAARRRMRGNARDLLRPEVAPWERAALTHTRTLLAELEAAGHQEVLVVTNDEERSPAEIASELAEYFALRYFHRAPAALAAGD